MFMKLNFFYELAARACHEPWLREVSLAEGFLELEVSAWRGVQSSLRSIHSKVLSFKLMPNLNNESLVVILHVPHITDSFSKRTFSILVLLFRYGSSDSPRGHISSTFTHGALLRFQIKFIVSEFFFSLCAYFCMWIAHKKPPTERSNMEKVHFGRREDFLLDLLFVRSLALVICNDKGKKNSPGEIGKKTVCGSKLSWFSFENCLSIPSAQKSFLHANIAFFQSFLTSTKRRFSDITINFQTQKCLEISCRCLFLLLVTR